MVLGHKQECDSLRRSELLPCARKGGENEDSGTDNSHTGIHQLHFTSQFDAVKPKPKRYSW